MNAVGVKDEVKAAAHVCYLAGNRAVFPSPLPGVRQGFPARVHCRLTGMPEVLILCSLWQGGRVRGYQKPLGCHHLCSEQPLLFVYWSFLTFEVLLWGMSSKAKHMVDIPLRILFLPGKKCLSANSVSQDSFIHVLPLWFFIPEYHLYHYFLNQFL